jgi:hypothetical protein
VKRARTMKLKNYIVLAFLFLVIFSLVAEGQSTMEFQSGTTIEVTSGADICADDLILNGTYSGSGTQCGGLLPVELITFNAVVKQNKIELTWQTSTEVNNHGFEIERGTTPVSPPLQGGDVRGGWQKIGFVEGAGNINSPKSYSYVDASAKGKVVYRLKQIDNDGKFSYSQTVEVIVSELPNEFALMQNYPNPFNPETKISYQIPASGYVSLKVYDMLGKEVATLVNGMQEAGEQQAIFSASKYPSGMYFYTLKSASFVETKRMVLVK